MNLRDKRKEVRKIPNEVKGHVKKEQDIKEIINKDNETVKSDGYVCLNK